MTGKGNHNDVGTQRGLWRDRQKDRWTDRVFALASCKHWKIYLVSNSRFFQREQSWLSPCIEAKTARMLVWFVCLFVLAFVLFHCFFFFFLSVLLFSFAGKKESSVLSNRTVGLRAQTI